MIHLFYISAPTVSNEEDSVNFTFLLNSVIIISVGMVHSFLIPSLADAAPVSEVDCAVDGSTSSADADAAALLNREPRRTRR